MYNPKYWYRHATPYLTEAENKKLESDLELMKKYTGNYKLRICDLLKTKVLADNLISQSELSLKKRRLDLLQENHKLLRKFLEIFIKTTSNINVIARDISRERLENPDTTLLKEKEWGTLLEQMEYFRKTSLALFDEIKKKFLWVKNQWIWY